MYTNCAILSALWQTNLGNTVDSEDHSQVDVPTFAVVNLSTIWGHNTAKLALQTISVFLFPFYKTSISKSQNTFL